MLKVLVTEGFAVISKEIRRIQKERRDTTQFVGIIRHDRNLAQGAKFGGIFVVIAGVISKAPHTGQRRQPCFVWLALPLRRGGGPGDAVLFWPASFRIRGTSMSVTTVTLFHVAAGQETTLLSLQCEGRRRMLAADGCKSFDILRDQADPRCSAFVQTWSSREAHDAAFGELIMASGHLEKVLATLDQGVIQTFYDVVS